MEIQRTMAQQIFLRIQEDIMDGTIKDGQIISERSLEQRFKVSRTPIKEALKLLESEGWVEITPRYKTRVTSFGVEDMSEILPVRIAMEGLAIKLCIQTFNKPKEKDFSDLLIQLESLYSSISKNDSSLIDAYNNLDSKFHKMICVHSNNKFILDFNTKMGSLFKRVYRNIPLNLERVKAGSSELIAIINYILKNNVILADISMSEHIINSTNQKLQFLKKE